jgi:DNA-binding transcriptional LysR family regulator
MDRLRALAALSAHGSITRAAAALHVTPSGVSQQLGKLEREAGRPLLEPQGRTVRLTRAGRILAAHAERVIAQLDAAAADLADLDEEVLGPLRIGGVGSAVRTLLPAALAELAALHPRLTPTVADGEAVDLLPRLLAGELDLLLVESWSTLPPALPEGVRLRTLVEEDIRVALADGHPLSGRAAVDLAELNATEGTVWACCPPGTGPHQALLQTLRSLGAEPEVRYALAEHATQLALVERNLAVALLPEMSQPAGSPGVCFRPTRPALRRSIAAAWLDRAAGPPVRACLDALEGVRAQN